MAKQNKPAIRFKEFADAWEQRKLSECAGFRRGSFPQPYGNKDWYDGEGAMPFVQVADVACDMQLVEDTKQKISKLAQPMSVFAEKGSVLVTLQGSIGRVAITQYGAFVDRTVLIFDKYAENIDKRFWAYIIKEKFEDEARKAPGGTIKTITKEALSDFELKIPSYEEQGKLADYLMNLDHLITLHQRKYDKLQVLKKAMLEKMFPKNGSSVPEIRFKGFTDAWEQRKLIDLLDQPITDGPHETPNIVDDGIPFISADAIVDNKIDFTRKRGNITEEYDLQCRKKYKPEFHDVYLVKSGSTVGKVAIVETTQRFNIWSPLAAMRCKKNSNPYFLFALLQTKENQAQVKDMNSRFDKYLKLLNQAGASGESIEQAKAELHKSFASLTQEEQKFANIFLHDIERGDATPEPGKTLRDYITEYQCRAKNDQIHRFAVVFGLDEEKLRNMMGLGLTKTNINEFGRLDELKKSVDKAKAKAYFEKKEGVKLIPPKVNQKVDSLLREFIVTGGFEV